ncbi:MAG: hypothetical protein IPL22_18520 [Bacteroidetes bacterium]|nr:hypothetical protein [Bacteroidota bacterium]
MTVVSGRGTTTIIVNFSAAGKIGCTAKNDCGDRGTKTLTVLSIAGNPVRLY